MLKAWNPSTQPSTAPFRCRFQKLKPTFPPNWKRPVDEYLRNAWATSKRFTTFTLPLTSITNGSASVALSVPFTATAFTPATDGPPLTPIEPASTSGLTCTSNPIDCRNTPEPIDWFSPPMLPCRKSKLPFLIPRPAPIVYDFANFRTTLALPDHDSPCAPSCQWSSTSLSSSATALTCPIFRSSPLKSAP